MRGGSWPLLLLALLGAAVAAAALLLGHHGGARGPGGVVAYAPCLRPEALGLLQGAAERLGLRLEPLGLDGAASARSPPRVYVVDAAHCPVREAAEAAANVLWWGGVAVVVGKPVEVSRLFHSERKVIMPYPLPRANATIFYVVHIVGHEWMNISGRLYNVSSPEALWFPLSRWGAWNALRRAAQWAGIPVTATTEAGTARK